MRRFKEFMTVHRHLLSNYQLKIHHYDPNIGLHRSQGLTEIFKDLNLPAGSEQTIHRHYFEHQPDNPHIILDGAGMYDYRAVTSQGQIHAEVVVGGGDLNYHAESDIAENTKAIKAVYCIVWGDVYTITFPLFTIAHEKVVTVMDALFNLGAIQPRYFQSSGVLGHWLIRLNDEGVLIDNRLDDLAKKAILAARLIEMGEDARP